MDILSNTVSFNEYWKANFVTTHNVEIVPLYINIFCLYIQLYQCFFNIFFKKVLKLPVFHTYVHLWENIFKSCTSAAVSDFCESTLQLMHISLIVNIRSSYTYLNGFQLIVPLPLLIEITFLVCTNWINLLNLSYSLHRLVIISKGFLKLSNLHVLIKQRVYFPETWLSWLLANCK